MAIQSRPTELFIHHTENTDALKRLTFAQCDEAARSIQSFHMDDRGWSDIGYHWLVFPRGSTGKAAVAYRARSSNYVPAAQLGHNEGTIAVAVYAGTEGLAPHTRYTLEQIINLYPTVRSIGGHRDVTATDCPGDAIYGAITQIAKASGRKRYSRAAS